MAHHPHATKKYNNWLWCLKRKEAIKIIMPEFIPVGAKVSRLSGFYVQRGVFHGKRNAFLMIGVK